MNANVNAGTCSGISLCLSLLCGDGYACSVITLRIGVMNSCVTGPGNAPGNGFTLKLPKLRRPVRLWAGVRRETQFLSNERERMRKTLVLLAGLLVVFGLGMTMSAHATIAPQSHTTGIVVGPMHGGTLTLNTHGPHKTGKI